MKAAEPCSVWNQQLNNIHRAATDEHATQHYTKTYYFRHYMKFNSQQKYSMMQNISSS